MRQHLLFHEDTMTPAITFEELLAWNCQSSDFWMAHLDANPALLQLPSGIGGTADVRALVRHIWGVELLWSQRIAGLPERNKEVWPAGPLHALFDLHLEAVVNFRNLLDDPGKSWDLRLILDRPGIPTEVSRPTHRKVLGHALLHSQRHWAQLSTLVRAAGFPSGFKGDLLFSPALG
jgi:uncharacterized damage-inducible protein DinB